MSEEQADGRKRERGAGEREREREREREVEVTWRAFDDVLRGMCIFFFLLFVWAF